MPNLPNGTKGGFEPGLLLLPNATEDRQLTWFWKRLVSHYFMKIKFEPFCVCYILICDYLQSQCKTINKYPTDTVTNATTAEYWHWPLPI